MKKIILRIIALFLAVSLIFFSYYSYKGYIMYQNTIDTKSISSRVEAFRGKEDYVKLEQISEVYQELVIESEDKRFYQHGPVDHLGLARAMVTNLATFSFKEGGSTITQQLAKNLCLTFEKSLDRKIAEVLIAHDLEENYSKDEILEMYLNITYLGEGNYGIKAASNYYYGIEPIALNEQQSKILVKTLKAPSIYNPSKISNN